MLFQILHRTIVSGKAILNRAFKLPGWAMADDLDWGNTEPKPVPPLFAIHVPHGSSCACDAAAELNLFCSVPSAMVFLCTSPANMIGE